MKEINFLSDILPLKDKLFRLALRITLDRAEAEDVVQDTLIRVWNRKDEWANIQSPEAFSTTICRNLALDRCAAARNSNITLDESQEHKIDASPPPDVAMDRQERIDLVKRQMNQLPEVQRTIMELRDIEGKSYQEIANILNITEAQVKVYLHRARQKIRTQVEKIERYGL